MEYTIVQDAENDFAWHVLGPSGGHWATFCSFSDAILFCVASLNWQMMIDFRTPNLWS